MICKHCGANIEMKSGHEVQVCPYCGSKELVQDQVGDQKVQNYEKSKLGKWMIIGAVITLALSIVAFKDGLIIRGIITLIQTGLFIASWLMGMRMVPEPVKNLHKALAGLALILLVPAMMLGGGDDKADRYDKEIAEMEEEVEEMEKETKEKEEAAKKEEVKEDVKEEVNDESAKTETAPASTGMRPEFKTMMDEYEKFFDEYIDFMKRYEDSGNSPAMMTDYLSYMDQFTKTMAAMDKVDDSELSTEEMAYYLEVTARIEKKLLEASL